MSENSAIYDARELGVPKMLILGLQHMFAMFGATVLVPIITGLDVATTLLCAGLGTLLFHVLTKMKVPAFLGSSFAFLGGYAAIAPKLADGSSNKELLPYACLGVACAGMVYFVLAALIRFVGVNKVMRYFPPVVTGPIIIAIGLCLAGSAINNCTTDWLVALVALAVVIIFNIWGKGMMKIIPIILGIVASYIVALFRGGVDFTPIKEADWFGVPLHADQSILAIDWSNKSLILSAIIVITPIALATMMEHIGDISAISATTGINYIKDPGLHRTLIGDGLATSLAALVGGPANTTYGENTGVLVLTKVYDPRVVRLAAIFATVLSFSPKFAAIIETIPTATIGGISFILYGMISAAGVRNIVDSQVDFTNNRNLIIAAIILVTSLGLTAGASFTIGSVTITLSGLAVASIAGIILNAILPGKDFEFSEDEPIDTGASLSSSTNVMDVVKSKRAKARSAAKKAEDKKEVKA
ncbi:MAG: uracil-xanthine permease [Ruminococcaceae bacterium]|nr:uracil-xanthine permease [Oscillospiraceae bacterium]